jgi:hypothetical protein
MPTLLFPSAVRDGAPQTLAKLFISGSDPVTIHYLLITSIPFAKIGCTCVHPCPMLGPPLLPALRNRAFQTLMA